MSTVEDQISKNKKKKPRFFHWIILICVIAALIAATIFVNSRYSIHWIDGYHSFPEKIQEMGWWGQLGIIGLMIAHCFIPFPAEFVALAAGSIYGTVHGTILTWIGAMIGAMLSFGFTRRFGQPFVAWALPAHQQKLLDEWTKDQGAFTLLISRFIPLIAFNLINYAAGLTKISWWTFFWTTGVGILPLTTAMVYMGGQMRELSWSVLLLVSAISIIVMAIAHFMQRQSQKKN